MRQIRENIWHVSYDDLGRPTEKGTVPIKGFGTIHLDIADENYIKEYLAMGYEPSFFVSRSDALDGWFVVVSRQRTSLVEYKGS